MLFGEAITRNIEQFEKVAEILAGEELNEPSSDVLRETDLLVKLQGDLYFSGEPIYDFAFWLANSHLMLGIFLHHPLSPLETGHRFIICVVTCLLIVFPVALVKVVWPQIIALIPITHEIPAAEISLVRTVLMAALVIGPRNIMKAKMKKIAMSDQESYLALTEKGTSASASARHQLKIMYRKQAIVYEGIGILTVLFCFGTAKYIQLDRPDLDTLNLLLTNIDGLGFAFTLEILFALVLPRKAKNPNKKCWGWFGRWRNERLWKESS